MSDDGRSYDDGYAAGYAEGFVEAGMSTADQPVFEVTPCICGVMSGGVRSPNPACSLHEGDVSVIRPTPLALYCIVCRLHGPTLCILHMVTQT
jgi:hypothetical protein